MSEDNQNPIDPNSQSSTPTPSFSETYSEPPVPPSPPRRVPIHLPFEKMDATYGLIIITVIVFIAQTYGATILHNDVVANWGMKDNQLINQGQLWRLITAAFLHGGLTHIAFNMYALYILGREMEHFYGPTRLVILYFVTAFSGNVFSYLFTTANSLGASTAIFGLLGAYTMLIIRNRSVFGRSTRRVLQNIVLVLVLNLGISLMPGIDIWGHLGGLLGGVAIGWFGGVEFTLAGDALNGLYLKPTDSIHRFPATSAAVFLAFGALVGYHIIVG